MKARGVRRVSKKSGGLLARQTRKHGGSKRRIWPKMHIGIDAETLEVRAVEVTSSNTDDAPMLPDLLNQIPPDQNIELVTADGSDDTRQCHDASAVRHAHAVRQGHGPPDPFLGFLTPTAQERQAVQAHKCRSHRPERGGHRVAISGPRAVAAMERISPQEPR